MTDASRYVRDTAYFSAFVPAQAPARLSVAALLAGAQAPDFRRPFRYLDLCCGDGVTLATLADCYPHAQFVGVDFDEGALAKARALTETTGLTNVEWRVSDVASITADGPEFHYISMVGAFSWLDEARRATTLERVSQRLTPDGLFLLHYASKPGAVQTEALHQALRLLAPERGDGAERMAAALERLRQADLAPFRKAHPLADEHLTALAQAPASAFAQEGLSPDSQAFWQPEIEEHLARAGLMPLVEADDLEPVWRPGETLEARRIRAVQHDFERNRLSRLDICRRKTEPDIRQARGLLAALAWFGSATAPRLDKLDLDDDAAWSAESAKVREAVRRSRLHPVVARFEPQARSIQLSRFNRYALEQGLMRPSTLPLASTTLGTQVVLPLHHRLQLYALTGGNAGELLRALAPANSERLSASLKPEALATFANGSLPRLIDLGIVLG